MGRETQLYGEGEIMAEWISTADRLPKVHEDVLVWDSTAKSVEWAFMTVFNEWIGVVASHKVTHWMPLPEPPKGE